MFTIFTRLEMSSANNNIQLTTFETKIEGMKTIFTRLAKASQMGDVGLLEKLLEEDPLLLERVMRGTFVGDNPLHIAALLGHADFAAKVINLNPDLAVQRNAQGLFPLHLAAAHGHLLMVKVFLTDSRLCLLREEKEGLMPLHVAVIHGRKPIVEELVKACEAAMHECTYRGETVMHFAVKSNSSETLEFLISQAKDLNVKDGKGNTMLHLAVSRKQLLVIKLLLSNENIDVNSMNMKASTPLDVLLDSPQEYGDLLLGEMIRKAGGRTAAEIMSSQPDSNSNDGSSSTRPADMTIIPSGINLVAQKVKKEKEYNTETLMLVAILITTLTFQAALNPPGGFIPANPPSPNQNAGHVVLADDLSFFLFFDIIGLFSSIVVILFLLCVVPRKAKMVYKFLVWTLRLATFSTALAYTLAIRSIYTIFFSFTTEDGSEEYYFSYSSVSIRVLLIAWFVVLRLGILWVSIRVIIFLLNKGDLLEQIQDLFSLIMQRSLLKWRRLNSTTEVTNRTKSSTSFRKIVFLVLAACVISSTAILFWGVYVVFRL